LETLCRTYWYPVYAYVRRYGCSAHDADDLTQGFFADLLERRALGRVVPGKGKFRSFLVACLKNYLRNELDKTKTRRRGGRQMVISLDEADAEGRYGREPVDEQSPDRLFERRWALMVLDQAWNRLREQYAGEGHDQQFEQLHGCLFPGDASSRYSQLAAALGATETTVRTWVHRMRRRYGETLRRIVAETVGSPAEVEEELHHLIAVVSR
jgi:RNA polymerase sigma-70 factor (ECF subfamily)